MGGSFSRFFGPKIDRNILLLGREGVGKTYLLYKMKGLTSPGVDLLPTQAFNHLQIDFHQFERQIEVWDPSGKPSHASFWSTFYQNVYFHVVIYVIDAKEYDPFDFKRKAAAIREDKMEIHTLLCDEQLRDTTMVVYLNWKADEMGRVAEPLYRAQVKSCIGDDLEFHTSAFIDRQIIVVDEMEDLQPYMLNLKHRLVQRGGGGGGDGDKSKGASRKRESSQSGQGRS